MLSDNDRRYILDQLRSAPDSVLADAMLALTAFRDKVIAVRKLTRNAEPVIEDTAPNPEPPDDDVPSVTTERPNVSPGNSRITKIGGTTKETLLASLKSGRQPSQSFTEHLKLLWARGDVKFDGEEFYL